MNKNALAWSLLWGTSLSILGGLWAMNGGLLYNFYGFPSLLPGSILSRSVQEFFSLSYFYFIIFMGVINFLTYTSIIYTFKEKRYKVLWITIGFLFLACFVASIYLGLEPIDPQFS